MEYIKTGHPVGDGGMLAVIVMLALSASQLAVALSIAGGILYAINQAVQIYYNLQKRHDSDKVQKD